MALTKKDLLKENKIFFEIAYWETIYNHKNKTWENRKTILYQVPYLRYI